ncbi:MAG: cell wall hydrolase [Lachnospiraceae bacterium]
MLTFCSFLQSLSQWIVTAFVNMTKKLYRNSTVVIVGGLIIVAMTGMSGMLGDNSRNSLTAYAETPMEQISQPELTGEIELLTEAKIPFQLTNLVFTEEGQRLVGETLAQSIELQQGLQVQQQERLAQIKEEQRLQEEEQERIAAQEAAKQAEEEARQAAAAVSCSTEDYEVLTRIVQAESGGCDIKGRILIANVIFNRVRSNEFPDSITDVVYQKSQFSPVADGSMKSCTVTDATVEAVDRALAGEDYSDGALYFMNRKLSRSHNVTWFDRELTYLFQYDKHEFFK